MVTSFSLGLNNVMDTTISQAVGAGKLRVCGIYLNQCRMISTIMFSVQVWALYYSKEVLIALGQNPEVSQLCQTYLLAYMPGMYF